MAIEFTKSAAKHGYTAEDAVHAMNHPLYVKERFERSRMAGLPDPTLIIGPTRGGTILEVMAYTMPPRTIVIFHCMEARPNALALIGR